MVECDDFFTLAICDFCSPEGSGLQPCLCRSFAPPFASLPVTVPMVSLSLGPPWTLRWPQPLPSILSAIFAKQSRAIVDSFLCPPELGHTAGGTANGANRSAQTRGASSYVHHRVGEPFSDPLAAPLGVGLPRDCPGTWVHTHTHMHVHAVGKESVR